jgi:hypothetical protein
MATFYARQNDNKVYITATLLNADKTPIDLSDISVVEFHVGKEGDPSEEARIIDADAAVIGDPTLGRVRYLLTNEDLSAEPATYDAEFEIFWPDGTDHTVPTKAGQFKFVIGKVVK